jgi:hypothetical protein
VTRLSELLAEAAFPIYGVRARLWDGDSFVGDAVRAPHLAAVQLVYVDPTGSNGCVVSSVEAGYSSGVDPFEAHLLGFVSRFDPSFLMRRVGRRRFVPFRADEFAVREMVVPVAGEQVGARLYTHRSIPVQLLRTARRRGDAATDLGVGAWRLDARALAAGVETVTLAFAKEFDAPRAEPYPPPEWTG